jgi:organic radical activating enzyme
VTAGDASLQPTWCVNPFLQAHQLMDAQLTPCCFYQGESLGKTINEYINSPKLRQLKTELLSGVHSAGCKKCWSIESMGLQSKRHRDNKTYQNRFQLLYHKKDLLEPNPDFAEYYVRLGNNCNLCCAICNDVLSTGWASENKKFGLPYRKKNNIKRDDPIWQHMIDHARHIKLIEFVGGEPLFINPPLQIEFLQKLIDMGVAKNVKLRYHTNGTKFNADIASLWQYFKEVTVWISIDGLEQSFEYQRYPAKWAMLTTNIKRFVDLASQYPNIKVCTNCTVSVLNILELDSMINWFNAQGIHHHLNVLESPVEYGLFNQEIELKQKILDRLSPITNPEIQQLVNNLLLAETKTQTQNLKSKLISMDQKRLLKYSECLLLADLLDF